MVTIIYLLLISIVGVAVLYDVKTYRIPNTLILLGIISGSLCNGIVYGFYAVLRSLTCMVITVAALFILYYFKTIGAGDVKLYGVVAAFVNHDVLYIVAASFVIVAVYGAYLYVRKRLSFYTRTRIAMSVPIFMGCVICVIKSLYLLYGM